MIKTNLYKFEGLELSQNKNLDQRFALLTDLPQNSGQKPDADQIK